MPRIEVITEIHAPLGVVFDLSRSIDVHELGQTRHREKAVAGRTSGLIEAGEAVTWEATHFGIRQRLTARIVAMRRPAHFRDSLVSGAFKRFDHDHFFAEAVPGVVTVTDVFDYTAPFGFIGRLADRLFLERHMRRLLGERNTVIKELAESGSYGHLLPAGHDADLCPRGN